MINISNKTFVEKLIEITTYKTLSDISKCIIYLGKQPFNRKQYSLDISYKKLTGFVI